MSKFFFPLFLLFFIPIFGQNVHTFSGRVLDENAKPLAYTTIVNSEFTIGTMTDEEGKFSLKLPEGQHIILLQYIGYKEYRDSLDLFSDINKNYQMQPEDLTTGDVIITSDGRDPAYGIIEKAIAKKKQNANPFPEYAFESYTKTLIGFPKSFNTDSLPSGLGFKIKSKKSDTKEAERAPELNSKILYLSETLSEVYVKEPEKAKENIVSSRVSGDSKSYSLFGNLISRFNPYDNRLVMEGVADRGIVLPLSESAMLYYDFKLLGIGNQNGTKYYKIKLLPKRNYDPVCNGLIYIADSSFAIKEIDIVISKTQHIEVMDSLRFKQQYSQINEKWLPYSTRMGFDFVFDLGVIKLPLAGFSVSLLSSYNVFPKFKKHTFSNEIIAVADTALNRPKRFWDTARPIPLTVEEEKDYRLKDSLENIRRSPRYLDSLQRSQNKVNYVELFGLGQTFHYRKIGMSLKIHSLLESVGFNPQEGAFVNPYTTITQKINDYRNIEVAIRLRYGFLSQKVGYFVKGEADGNKKHLEKWRFSGGDYIAQFAGFDQVDMYLNTVNTLFYKWSLARLYQQKSLAFSYERELFNGLLPTLSVSYQDRTPMQNLTDYSWSKKKEVYASNNPINPLFPTIFSQNQAFVAEVNLSYTPGQQFISVPHQKIVNGAKFPTFQANLIHAFAFTTTAADFTKLKLSIEHDTKLGMLGNLQWQISAAKFLQAKQVYFPDLFHYKAVETHLHLGDYQAFFLLPYYGVSTASPYLEAHAQQAFHGFLLNKVPLIRKLKLSEYVGCHALWQENGSPYMEMNVGVEKKLMKLIPLRIDFCFRVMGQIGSPYTYKFWVPETSSVNLGGR